MKIVSRIADLPENVVDNEIVNLVLEMSEEQCREFFIALKKFIDGRTNIVEMAVELGLDPDALWPNEVDEVKYFRCIKKNDN